MSRAVWPVVGYGDEDGRRVRYRPSLDRVRYRPSLDRVRYRPSLDHVRYRPSLDHVSSCPGPCRRPHVSAAFTVGRAEGPSSAMPRPNSACSRRRQPLCANIYSFTRPWRFMNARPAARLRRIVGPLSSRHTVPNRPGSRRDRASPRIIGDNRTSSDIIEQSNITEHIANLNQL